MLDDQLLELLDLVAFETPVLGHDTILAEILHRSSCTFRYRKKGRSADVLLAFGRQVSASFDFLGCLCHVTGEGARLATLLMHLCSGLLNF